MSQYMLGKVSRYLFLIALFSSLHFSFSPAFSQPDSASVSEQDAHPADYLVRGERLFYGLVYYGEKSVNCAGCHNTRHTDTLNWNPDALEISKRYLDKSAEELAAVLLKPRGKKLAEVHAEIDLVNEDIVMIKGFMDHFAIKGMKKSKPVINNILLLIFFSGLLLFSLSDLTVFKFVKRKWVHLLILLVSFGWISNMLVKDAVAIGRSPMYEPDQPIKFSHLVHSGQNETECLYCHHSATQSKSAGLPSLNVCMNCHLVVRQGENSGSWEISKLIDAYENNKAVEWVRIHNLPDHSYFNHAQHVEVAGLDCAECHGNIEEMDRVHQVADLSMGWCVNCHRETQVDFHSNEFYKKYEGLVKDVMDGKVESVTTDLVGGIECMKCHY